MQGKADSMETSENTPQTEVQPAKKHQVRKTNGGRSGWSKFISWLQNPSSDFALFVILLVLINLVGVRAFARFDLTGPKSYSLSAASKEAVKTIEEPLSIKVFFSSNLPAPYSNVDQYVRDILVEYKNAASTNFSYEYYDMEKPESQKLASSYGLQQIQIQEVKNNEVGLKNAYMGIVFVYADQIEKLDGLSSSDGLEYKITTTINKIVSSANLLTGLSGNVRLTLYKTEKLSGFNINGFDQIDTSVENAYNSVNKKNMGRIDFQKIDPPSDQVQKICEKYGLQAINWNQKDGTTGHGVIGLVLEYNDSFRVVPLQMVNMFFSYAISGLDKLDDTITESLQSLVSRTSKIGYLTGNGELELDDDQQGAKNFNSIVSDIYSLEPLNLEKDDIPSDMQCIIVNGPKTAFADKALYKLDQFIMRGGNVMFFLDPYDVQESQNQNSYYQQPPQYIPIRTGLEKLLSKYGVECGTNYVLDEKCFTRLQQQYGKLTVYYAPQLTGKSLNKKHPVSRNLNEVIFVQAGSIDVTNAEKNSDEQVTVLAKSSPASWTMSDNIMLNPMYIQPPADKSTEKSENLAVLVEGKFSSAYDKAPTEDEQTEDGKQNKNVTLDATTHLAKSTQSGKLFIASSSYITSPMLLTENSSEPIALFLRNAVDYLNGEADLCTMRTKGLSLNTLDKTTSAFANVAKYFNEFGLAVLVALAGLIVLLVRQHHRNQIRIKYDPSDSRQISRGKKEE